MPKKRLKTIGDGSLDDRALAKRPKNTTHLNSRTGFWSDYEGDSSLEDGAREEDAVRDTARIKREPSSGPPTTAVTSLQWALTATQIPLGAKKIYCILRGHQPGFYFDWPSAERQVKGFPNNVYKSFPQGKKGSVTPQIVVEAIEYMNHDSTSCRYGCGGKCFKQAAVPILAAVVQPGGRQDEVKTEQVQQKVEDLPPERITIKSEESKASLALPLDALSSDEPSSSDDLSPLDKTVAQFNLDPEQTEALRLVATGRNVFVTGAAGTGKSRVIEAIVSYLKKMERNVSVVAPTGIAALNVSGTTLHVWAGWTVKLGESPLHDLIKVAHEKKVRDRIGATQTLIIDEISMLSSDTFKRLAFQCEEVLKHWSGAPFGGIQLVVCGDFFQLPPVEPFIFCLHCGTKLLDAEDGLNSKVCAEHGQFLDKNKWPFRSNLWTSCNFANIQLKKIHRQTDHLLTHILGRVREGQMTEKLENFLLHHPHDVVFDDAVKLTPRRWEAENINDGHMAALPYAVREYDCIDDLTWVREHPEFLQPTGGMSTAPLQSLQHHKYGDFLELKEGMQVILIHNLDPSAGLVNGSVGKIVGFEKMSEETLPRAQKNSRDVAMCGEELITHKYRGYAADKIHAFRDRNRDQEWPVVRFSKGQQRIIYAHCSITELGKEEPFSLLSRTTIPLIAGWAITIHKSQGLTLDNVVVTLDKSFVPGQAYVALSRARSLRSMVVQTLPSRENLMPDETVREFMKETFG